MSYRKIGFVLPLSLEQDKQYVQKAYVSLIAMQIFLIYLMIKAGQKEIYKRSERTGFQKYFNLNLIKLKRFNIMNWKYAAKLFLDMKLYFFKLQLTSSQWFISRLCRWLEPKTWWKRGSCDCSVTSLRSWKSNPTFPF